jgi:hypothetical protein
VPIARYFIFVGGTLAALLFIPGWCLPEPPAMFADRAPVFDRAVIRIKSAHKWPEKIILDTSQRTIVSAAVEGPSAARWGWLPSDEPRNQSSLEAMAQLKPDTPAVDRPTSQIKRGEAKAVRPRRRLVVVARGAGQLPSKWIRNEQDPLKSVRNNLGYREDARYMFKLATRSVVLPAVAW